jgi:hypothetical protein
MRSMRSMRYYEILCVSMHSMRGAFIFRNRGPSLEVHHGQCLTVASMSVLCAVDFPSGLCVLCVGIYFSVAPLRRSHTVAPRSCCVIHTGTPGSTTVAAMMWPREAVSEPVTGHACPRHNIPCQFTKLVRAHEYGK